MEAKANGRPDEERAVTAAVVDPADHVLGLLGMRDVDIPEGADLAMTLPVTPRVTNNRGGLQGGLLATLVDVVAGRAVGLRLADGDSAATSDMNMHFLSAVTVGPAHATARVLRHGKSLIVVQVDVRDEGRDVLAAVATLSFAVLPLRPGQPRARG
ncbi:PaaI family thioesterase [Actinocorallia sp. B10E7]|uniref:PaaI family thioesterase n=1 Tax=Actinocorallia sp. B10E7 TaxID=3153558 RepID=UPI00325D5195